MTTEDLLQLHQETSARCLAIMRRKNSDYTGGQGTDDPFANFNMSASFGIHPALGVVLRIGDKLQRIRSFANDGTLQVTGETIDDACEDIVNYAIILKAMFRAQAAQYSVGLDVAHLGADNTHAPADPEGDYPDPEWHEPDHYGHGAYAASLDIPVLEETLAPKKYRLLEEGELVKPGDEYCFNEGPWLPSHCHAAYNSGTHYPHRRLEHV